MISVPRHLVGVVRIISVENSKRSVCTCTELPSWVPRHQCISSSTLERVTLLSEQPSECLNHRFRATKFLFLLSQQKTIGKCVYLAKKRVEVHVVPLRNQWAPFFCACPVWRQTGGAQRKVTTLRSIYKYREWQKRDSTHNGGARWCSPQS